MEDNEIIDKIELLSNKVSKRNRSEFNVEFINYYNKYKKIQIVRRIIVKHFYKFNFNEDFINDIILISQKLGIKINLCKKEFLINESDTSFQRFLCEAYQEEVLTHKVQNELLSKGDQESKLYLFKHSLRLPIYTILHECGIYSEDKMDILNEGVIALYDAIETYKINKKCTFASYAITCIKNKVSNYIKENIIPKLYKGKFTLFKKIPFKVVAEIFNGFNDKDFVKSKLELYLKNNEYQKQKTINYILDSFITFISLDYDYQSIEGYQLREEDPRNTDDYLYSEAFMRLREDLETLCSKHLSNKRKLAYYYLKGINDYPKLTVETISKKFGLTKSQILNTETKVIKLLESKQYSYIRKDWNDYLEIRERNYERL